MSLDVRAAAATRYDAVALGEVMLRLDPGEGRIRTARSFQVSEGGGEYNVVRGLRRVFGMRVAVVTALVDNEVGRLVEDLVLAGGVDTGLVRWVEHDGIGRSARTGLNFTERGFGVRGGIGVSDRGHTAASQLGPDDVDWDTLFSDFGVRWLHTGGIFAALSDRTARTTIAAVEAAQRHGTVVSYDFNHRPSLWRANGGPARAQKVSRAIVPHVDVLLGGRHDVEMSLGLSLGTEADADDVTGFAAAADRLAHEFPNLAVVAATRRTVHSASVNDWGAMAWSAATGVLTSTHRARLEILDRVGGGDSFASGLVCGLLEGTDLATALEYGAAHGALAMTTPGDSSAATRAEVLHLAAGGDAAVDR
jgi:2-dehydro-3-deoxygluconokinase